MIKVYLPKNLNFILLNNKFIYLYNDNFFVAISLHNHSFCFNRLLGILQFNDQIPNIKYNKNFLSHFIFLWDSFFFTRLYFLGKGYKLKKVRNNVYFNFNHSHIKLIIFNKVILKKIQKNKILAYTKNYAKLKNIGNLIEKVKKLNFYTKRGIRKTKQITYTKKST